MNTFRRSLSTPLLLLTALVLLAASAAVADGGLDYATKRLREVPDAPYEDAPVRVEIWTDRGDGSRYCAGEDIEVFFRTDADAWVAIFDIDTRGEIHRLFPSRHAPDNFVRAHRTYRLPSRYGYHFEVEGPTGWETLRAVASTDRRALRRYARDLRLPSGHRSRDLDWDDGYRGRYAPTSQRSDGRYEARAKRLREVPDGSYDDPSHPHSAIVSVADTRHFVRDGHRCRVPRPWWRRR